MHVKRIAAYAIGPVGAALLSLITLPVLAWLYSPEDIGRYALLHVLVSLTFLACSLGLEQAYVREFYDHSDNAALLRTTFIIGFMMVSALALCLVATAGSISLLLFEVADARVGFLLAFCTTLNFVMEFSLLSLRMRDRALQYSMVTIVFRAAFIISILALYLVQFPKSFLSLMWAHAASTLIACMAALWFSRFAWLSAWKAQFLSSEVKKLLAFSGPLVVGGISYWGLSSFDRIALKAWSSLDQLGTFSVAASFAGVATIARTIFSTIWTPFVFRWNKEGIDIAQMQDVSERILFFVLLIWGLCGSFAWLVEFILPEEYHKVPSLIAACMAVPLLYILSETRVVGLHIARKTIYSMFASLISLLVGVTFLYIFVPSFGAGGAASASCLAFGVFLVLRTEFSILAWQPFSRSKLYFFVLLYLSVSVLQTTMSDEWRSLSFCLWFMLLIATVACFQSYARKFAVAASQIVRGKSLNG